MEVRVVPSLQRCQVVHLQVILLMPGQVQMVLQPTHKLSLVFQQDHIHVVTDEVGLSVSQTFVVTETAAIEANAAITNATNGASNGAINLTTAGGTGNLSIVWNNGATGASINNLAAGTYTAVVTDENGCQKTFTFIVKALLQ